MGLRIYVLKRLLYTIVLIWGVISVNFIIFMMLPLNPAEMLASSMRIGKADVIESLTEQWGLNEPFHIKYVKYVGNMLTWQFGYSYTTNKPVFSEAIERLENTLLLVIPPEIMSIVVGIGIGAIAAKKRGKWFDNLSVTSSLTVYSLPVFWVAMMLILVFSHNLGWFPSAYTHPDYWLLNPPTNIFEIFGTRITHLILPWTTLFLISCGSWILLTRASVLEAITEDFVVTAKAKGLKERTILFKHTLRNALLPIVTDVAITFGFMLSGAIVTEQVFVYPGLGWWTWIAIDRSDYPVLQAIFFIVALCVIIANLIADLTYGIVDPRIKYG